MSRARRTLFWFGLNLTAITLASLAVGCRRSRPVLQRGDAAVVVLAPPVPIPAGLLAIPEREPAGPQEGPVTLPLAGSPGLAVIGTLGEGPPGDEEDLFVIEVPGPPAAPDGSAASGDAVPGADAAVGSARALSIEVTPAASLATSIQVREVNGPTLGTSSGTAGQHHGLPNLGIRPGGRYLIALRHDRPQKSVAPTGGSYALILREGSLGAADEREPNDSIETATAFAPASTAPEMAGYFGTTQDRDTYRVPIGEASEATVISVFLAPPSTVAPSLTVFDRNGGRLQSTRGRPGERIVLHGLAPAALSPAGATPTPGYFYLAAQTEAGSDREHRYVLGVRSEPWPEGEREPNDLPVRATLVGAGSTSGFLGPSDVDFFRCDVPAGQEVFAEVISPKRVDVVLELLMPGAPRPQRADAVRRGQSERLSATTGIGGSALVRVQGRRVTDYDNEETYTLRLELRAAPSDNRTPR